jgi:hypothetical protein
MLFFYDSIYVIFWWMFHLHLEECVCCINYILFFYILADFIYYLLREKLNSGTVVLHLSISPFLFLCFPVFFYFHFRIFSTMDFFLFFKIFFYHSIIFLPIYHLPIYLLIHILACNICFIYTFLTFFLLLVSVFYKWISRFSCTICWTGYHFSNTCFRSFVKN